MSLLEWIGIAIVYFMIGWLVTVQLFRRTPKACDGDDIPLVLIVPPVWPILVCGVAVVLVMCNVGHVLAEFTNYVADLGRKK